MKPRRISSDFAARRPTSPQQTPANTLRSKKRRGGATLSDLVMQVYPGKKPEDVQLIAAHARWHLTQSKLVRQNARPSKLRGEVLYVVCTTSSWAQELTFKSEAILASLRVDEKLAAIQSLRFQVGKVAAHPDPDIAPKPPSYAHIPESVARSIASVSDPELQHAIAGAASAVFDEEELRKRPPTSYPTR